MTLYKDGIIVRLLNEVSNKLEMETINKIKFLKLNRPVLLGLVLSFSIIVLHDFFSIQPSNHFIYQCSELVFKLSLSYCAAFIFYFLNVAIPEKRRREKLYPFVERNIRTIIGDYSAIVNKLNREANTNFDCDALSPSEVKILCQNFNPQKLADDILSFNLEALKNLDVLLYRRKRTLKAIAECERVSPWLEAELLSILFRIEHSSFLEQLEVNEFMRGTNTDINYLCNGLAVFSSIIMELKQYSEKRLNKFIK